MKKIIMGFVVALLLLPTGACTRVDAGYEGIRVRLAGPSRGVESEELVTGWVWYNPMFTRVYHYPTFVQTIDYPPFTINAQDGSLFGVDPTLSLHITPGRSTEIFQRHRRTLDEIINTTLFNFTKDAFRIQMNAFTTDQIVSMRDSLERNIYSQLRDVLYREGFTLLHLTSGLQYPETIVRAVNERNVAIQRAFQAENELAIARAHAEIEIVRATAERDANLIRQQGLTPNILRQMEIDKWNGALPQTTLGANTPFLIGGVR